MLNETVKFDNDLLRIDFSPFTPTDKKFFMAMLYLAKDKQADTTINLTLDDLRYLGVYSETTNISYFNLERQIVNFAKKVGGLSLRYLQADQKTYHLTLCPLFSRIDYYGNKNTVDYVMSFKVNPEAMPYLYEVIRQYTSFPLAEYQSLRSGYAQNLYFHLSQFADTGWWQVSKEAFCSDMGIPKTYPEKEITRIVLKPAIEECSKFFPNLTVSKVYGKHRTVIGYRFEWLPKSKTDLPDKEQVIQFVKDYCYLLKPDEAFKILSEKINSIDNWQAYLLGVEKKKSQKNLAELDKLMGSLSSNKKF